MHTETSVNVTPQDNKAPSAPWPPPAGQEARTCPGAAPSAATRRCRSSSGSPGRAGSHARATPRSGAARAPFLEKGRGEVGVRRGFCDCRLAAAVDWQNTLLVLHKKYFRMALALGDWARVHASKHFHRVAGAKLRGPSVCASCLVLPNLRKHIVF